MFGWDEKTKSGKADHILEEALLNHWTHWTRRIAREQPRLMQLDCGYMSKNRLTRTRQMGSVTQYIQC
jgi:hypothetical protein